MRVEVKQFTRCLSLSLFLSFLEPRFSILFPPISLSYSLSIVFIHRLLPLHHFHLLLYCLGFFPFQPHSPLLWAGMFSRRRAMLAKPPICIFNVFQSWSWTTRSSSPWPIFMPPSFFLSLLISIHSSSLFLFPHPLLFLHALSQFSRVNSSSSICTTTWRKWNSMTAQQGIPIY